MVLKLFTLQLMTHFYQYLQRAVEPLSPLCIRHWSKIYHVIFVMTYAVKNRNRGRGGCYPLLQYFVIGFVKVSQVTLVSASGRAPGCSDMQFLQSQYEGRSKSFEPNLCTEEIDWWAYIYFST